MNAISEGLVKVRKAQHSETWIWHCPSTECTAESFDCHGSAILWATAIVRANQHARRFHNPHRLSHDTTVPIPIVTDSGRVLVVGRDL